MSLKKQVEQDIKKAMLSRSKNELRALRAIKSQITLAATEKGAGAELSKETEMAILLKAVKQRKESASIYKEQKRDDLYQVEMAELEVINRFLPKSLNDEELRKRIESIISEVGATSIKDMGKIMGVATKALAGHADGKRISEMVRTFLSE